MRVGSDKYSCEFEVTSFLLRHGLMSSLLFLLHLCRAWVIVANELIMVNAASLLLVDTEVLRVGDREGISVDQREDEAGPVLLFQLLPQLPSRQHGHHLQVRSPSPKSRGLAAPRSIGDLLTIIHLALRWEVLTRLFGPYHEFIENFSNYVLGSGFLGLINR